MADLYEQASKFRSRLMSRDKQAAATLVRSYQTAYEGVNAEIVKVQRQIAKMRDDGVPRADWEWMLYRERRLDVLRERVGEQLNKYGSRAQIIIGGSIDSAIDAGRTDAFALIDTAIPDGLSVSPAGAPNQRLGPFAPETVRVPTAGIEQLTAITQPGGALQQLLAPLGKQASDDVARALIQGITIGENPRRIATRMRGALGGSLNRALTISRTETLRAYREASRISFQSASDVLAGWVWIADLSKRTCAACWAQHGSKHPFDEIMSSHPNCRCTMAPLTKSWEELGFGKTPESVQVESGPDLFKKLPDDDKAQILGPSKFAAYKSKKIALEDVVVRRQSPVWGPTSSVGSLRAAEDAARVRRGVPEQTPAVVDDVVTKPFDLTDARQAEELLRQVESEIGEGVVDGQLSLTKVVTQKRGFDALGEVVPDAEWDDLLAREGLQPMFRGITDDYRNPSLGIGQQRAQQFLTGDLFVGRGIYGSGTYTADATWRMRILLNQGEDIAAARKKAIDEAEATAASYAGGNGSILEMALKPGAKIVDYDSPDVKDAFLQWQNENYEAVSEIGSDLRQLMFKYEMGGDFAVWAMEQGFDAVKVVSGNGERESYTVVLNRGAVYVRDLIRRNN